MNIKIGKGSLNGRVRIISSKSDAHRALIAAALGEDELLLFTEGWSEDIEATTRCLRALGADIAKEPSGTMIDPILRDETADAVLDCGESGSTLRFLLPVAGALGRHTLFEGQGRLPERPIGVLLDEMEKNGCKFSGRSLPLEMEGKLHGGTYTQIGRARAMLKILLPRI